MTQFDLLIVGAGPAGSFAAELLAKSGAKVALFDGRPAGEPKACGGGVTAKALKAWPNLLNAVGRTINELDLYSPSGKRLHLKLDEPFAVYSRVVFDGYLRDRARDAGAQVFSEKISARKIKKTNSAWRVEGESGEWSGSVLVGADGANSGIARMLAGPLAPSEMEMAFGYRAPLPLNGEASTTIAFLPNWDGYVWAFPGTDRISIGIATAQTTFDHERLELMLLHFLDRYYRRELDSRPLGSISRDRAKSLKARIEIQAEPYAARIPKLNEATLKNRQVAASDWALLGDAAGFADAITGEGIYYALQSAALFATSYLRGECQNYDRLWHTEFGEDLIRAARLRSTFYGDFLGSAFTNRMIQFSHYHPGIRRTLTQLIGGQLAYSKLKHTLVKRLVRPGSD
jgi:geranylgeranyl reductase family protein